MYLCRTNPTTKMWEGGLRVRSFLTGSLVPAARRGTVWDGMAHSSDWYLTFVEGVAGNNQPLPPSAIAATGPRAPDGFNLWPALTSGGASPRSEVIHQVTNNYSEIMNLTTPACIQVGKYKLILGRPSTPQADAVVPFPEPSVSSVPFGLSKRAAD